jgi:hypothetical protein
MDWKSVAQVVERQPSKYEALNLNSSTTKEHYVQVWKITMKPLTLYN